MSDSVEMASTYFQSLPPLVHNGVETWKTEGVFGHSTIFVGLATLSFYVFSLAIYRCEL
jgi:hypothetical protein